MRRRARSALHCLAAALLVAVPGATLSVQPPAAAQPLLHGVPVAAGSGLDGARHELGDTSPQMLSAVAALRDAERALPAARADLAAVRAQLTAAEAAAVAAAESARAAQLELRSAERAGVANEQRVTDQRTRIGRLARAAYQRGRWGDVATLLESRSPADFTERYVSLRTVMALQQQELDDLQSASATFESRLSALEHRRAGLTSTHDRAEALVEAVERLETAATAGEQAVERLVAGRSAALAAARAAVAEDERRALARTTSASGLSATLRQQASALGVGRGSGRVTAGSASGPVAVRPGLLRRPVDGALTSPYGMRVHPITGVHKLHSGTDFGAPCGTPVASALAGTVLQGEVNRAYGNRVVVVHGVFDGALLATTYNHLRSLDVTPGQVLAAGDVLGQVGSTGYSTGCHLHLELLLDGDFVDPVPWLLP